jgi:hypothetical protein
MAIRTRLTVRDTTAATSSPAAPPKRPQATEAERAQRKERVAAAKDALKRSAGLRGEHVASARAALRQYLQRLNEPGQPDDATFQALVESPFQAPPKKRDRR